MGNPDDYREIIQQNLSPGTLVLALEKLQEQGRHAAVVQTCLRALELYPDHIRIRGLLADAYQQMGFLGQAEAELEKVTADLDELVTAYKQLAMVYARQHRIGDALRAVRRYLAHHPQDRDALALLAGSAGGHTELHEEMDKDLASPILAEIYVDQDRLQDALKTYENVVQKNPNDMGSRARLEELKSELDHKSGPPGRPRNQTQRTIDALEAWLAKIRETNV